MVLKGQSSVELTMVVSMALVISSPFILASQSSLVELDDASRFLTIDNSLDTLKANSVELNGSSYPARKTVRFHTPSGVEKVYNPTDLASGSALVFEMESKSGTVNRSIVLDLVLDVDDTGELESQGLHDLSVRKAENQVNVSVIS